MTVCEHTSVIREWMLDENFNYKPKTYGCTNCDISSSEQLSNGMRVTEHTHIEYDYNCFACKIQTLQLNTGDANGNLVANNWNNKKWDRELDLYASARKQGIQPDGTSTAKIRQAMDVSDKTGYAYGSDL